MNIDARNNGTRVDTTDGVETWVAADECSPKDIWDDRERLNETLDQSKQFWDSLTPEQKELSLTLVRRAVARFYDRAEEWLPEGFIHQAGEKLTEYIKQLRSPFLIQLPCTLKSLNTHNLFVG